MDLTVPSGPAFFNKSWGLLGLFDGDASNDFRRPDGTIIPANSTDQDIHYNFGLLWQIGATESLFTYASGESVDTMANASYVVVSVSYVGGR